MTKEEFTLVSEADGLKIACLKVIPDGEIKGVIQIVHGMTEHKERYMPLIEFLANNGFAVFASDHRGHGDSVKDKKDWGYFYDEKGEAVVEDVYLLTKEIRRQYPDKKLILYGHSMGALIVRCYLQKYDSKIDGMIVCGAPYENPLAGVGLLLVKWKKFFHGDRYRSNLINKMTLDGDKKFKGEGKGAWLTRDKSVVEKYQADEKCNYIFTLNGFQNLLYLMKHTFDKKRYLMQNPDLPIRFIAGGDDPVIGDELKWLHCIEFLRERSYKNVSGKLYEGMRHEIHNEQGKETVFEDVLSFVKEITRN